MMKPPFRFAAIVLLCAATISTRADSDVYLLGVPDYQWYAGCFGTACGNLMGYWDRHGMNDFYTNGLAPLDDYGANVAIRSMWASREHIADYWSWYNNDSDFSYESTVPDPYITAGRKEHQPNCVGDFIGLSQKKWVSMNGECDGNIDAYSFVYWDLKRNRRWNYVPNSDAGLPTRDIQSGLRDWSKWRGYDADVFTQLADFNHETPGTNGFTYEDVKAEINAGYPLLVFLQPYGEYSRSLNGMARANPEIHGVLIYGYEEYPDFGSQVVHIRTSWGIGESRQGWTTTPWLGIGLSVRGVIGFRPKPRVRSIQRAGNSITLRWDGPSSQLFDNLTQTTTPVHHYQIQRSTKLSTNSWTDIGPSTTDLFSTITDSGGSAFYRLKLLN